MRHLKLLCQSQYFHNKIGINQQMLLKLSVYFYMSEFLLIIFIFIKDIDNLFWQLWDFIMLSATYIFIYK